MHKKRISVVASVVAILLLFMLFALASPMGIVRAGQVSGVIASGLNNPRGITLGPDGMLYIAEAGFGGPDLGDNCAMGPEGLVCLGESGGVSRVSHEGTGQERLVDNMASIADPNSGVAAGGPHDVVFDEAGDMFVTVGLGANPLSRTTFFGSGGANLGQLAQIVDTESAGYSWSNVVDIGQYEADANPDGGAIDSNPWGALPIPGSAGEIAVTDAGGNSLLHVDIDADVVSTLAVFPDREVVSPEDGTSIPMQAVPVGMNYDANGDYLVGQLTGFPFPVGGAYIFNVPQGGGDPTAIEMDFTHALDVVYASDGSIFVLEMDSDGLFAGDFFGSVIQVLPGGARQTLADNLGLPTGMTLGPDRALYVTVCQQTAPIPVPCIAGMGAVVRIETELPTDVSLSAFSGDTGGGSPFLVLLVLILAIPLAGLVLRRRSDTI